MDVLPILEGNLELDAVLEPEFEEFAMQEPVVDDLAMQLFEDIALLDEPDFELPINELGQVHQVVEGAGALVGNVSRMFMFHLKW